MARMHAIALALAAVLAVASAATKCDEIRKSSICFPSSLVGYTLTAETCRQACEFVSQSTSCCEYDPASYMCSSSSTAPGGTKSAATKIVHKCKYQKGNQKPPEAVLIHRQCAAQCESFPPGTPNWLFCMRRCTYNLGSNQLSGVQAKSVSGDGEQQTAVGAAGADTIFAILAGLLGVATVGLLVALVLKKRSTAEGGEQSEQSADVEA
eukprot:PLAT13502.1.p1 GENE.PLAT13502.1~~PLAT13502.1.p1  ORF type:complete len:230 (+),score=39.84 PLAT13502.1:64-690(+)